MPEALPRISPTETEPKKPPEKPNIRLVKGGKEMGPAQTEQVGGSGDKPKERSGSIGTGKDQEEKLTEIIDELRSGRASEIKKIKATKLKPERLSLPDVLEQEGDKKIGNHILFIAKRLESQPQVAQFFFSEYARIIDNSEQAVEEATQLYSDIFFEKQPNKNQIRETIYRRGHNLLFQVSQELENVKEEDKENIIKRIIQDLKKQDEATVKNLAEFKEINARLEQAEHELFNFMMDKIFPNASYEHSLEHSLYKDYFTEMDKDKHSRFAIDFLAAYPSGMMKIFESQGLVNILNLTSYEDFWEKYGIPSKIMQKKYIQFARQHIVGKPEDPSIVDEWEKRQIKMEQFQGLLSEKLEALIFGHESALLPKDFQETIEADIKKFKPELTNQNRDIYLPVGISSEPPKKKEIHNKPIDILVYMFWLNNQGQDAEFLVVDTIQESNYRAFPESKRPSNPREAALENGRRDKKWYQAVIEAFSLSYLHLGDYQTIEKDPQVEKALKLITEIAEESPKIAKALKETIQSSIIKKAENAENLENYGKTEIAFILAKNGLKIGHEKEHRYDVIARVIPIYRALSEHCSEIPRLNKIDDKVERDQALVDLSLYFAYYKDFPESYRLKADIESKNTERNKKRSQKRTQVSEHHQDSAQKLSEEINSLTHAIKVLQEEVGHLVYQDVSQTGDILEGIKPLAPSSRPERIIASWKEIAKSLSDKSWLKSVTLPEFSYPLKTSGLVGSREPYSTYKGERATEVAIEANQVLASTDILASAKLLVQSDRNQAKYFEHVLRPLLVNFYLATSQSPEQAVSRFREDTAPFVTIAELIKLIQRKIIAPIENKIQEKQSDNNNQEIVAE